jgi:hypothetical protein
MIPEDTLIGCRCTVKVKSMFHYTTRLQVCINSAVNI